MFTKIVAQTMQIFVALIRAAYEKENKEKNLSRVFNELKYLQPYLFSEKPKKNITYKCLFTIIDGKVLKQMLLHLRSCLICHKTYRQIAHRPRCFNPKVCGSNYGFSILHFVIGAFETIGCKQDIKKNSVHLSVHRINLILE